VNSVPPVRREVLVNAGPEDAFRVFTERINSWWPLAVHSVHGVGGTVSFDAGDIVEVAASGERCVWGTVTSWQPGQEVAFTWHPGETADKASRVTVTFAAADGSTLVTLVHDRWEAFAQSRAAREEYNNGWVGVLEQFVAAVPEAA
jgi:hypothetical protein